MKTRLEGEMLVVQPGGLRGTVRVPLAAITRWDILYEVMGRRFLAFHLGDRTAFVQLPRLDPEARAALAEALTQLTGKVPDVSLLDGERDNEHWVKVWEFLKWIGRYLRLFINPLRPPGPPPGRLPPRH